MNVTDPNKNGNLELLAIYSDDKGSWSADCVHNPVCEPISYVS